MAKTVVLDVDGTLMDTNYLHVEAWARAFEDVGHRVPRVELHRQIGKGSELLIREFVEDDETVEIIKELLDAFSFIVALNSAYFWNVAMEKVLTQSSVRGWSKDSANGAIAYLINGVKDGLPS